MYMFGAINIVLFAFVWFLIPETKGVSLEHMDHLFGGIDHTDRGAEMLDAKGVGRIEDEPTVETQDKVAVDGQREAGEGGDKAPASK